MKRMTLLAALLAGCLPKPDTKTTPAEQKPVEVVVRVVTEGGINVVGSGTIDVKAQAPTASGVCECGCGKAGCACNRPELSLRDGGSRMDARASDRVAAEPRPERDQREVSAPVAKPSLTVLSVAGCAACDIAVADLQRLGFTVTKVMTDEAGEYPQVTNRKGERYKPEPKYYFGSDGKRYFGRAWQTGVDDVAAAKQLSE